MVYRSNCGSRSLIHSSRNVTSGGDHRAIAATKDARAAQAEMSAELSARGFNADQAPLAERSVRPRQQGRAT